MSEPRPSAASIKAEQLPYPASQEDMQQKPDSDLSNYKPAGKLKGKVALITGGDSGIGRAVAIAFAMEGADVAVIFNQNAADAEVTGKGVKKAGRKFLSLQTDIRDMEACHAAVERTVKELGGLNILVNNAHYQMAHQEFDKVPAADLRRTIETNVLGTFWMTQAAIPHLTKGDSIINTGSIVGEVGNELLVDYCTSKGGIHAFTKALAMQLGPKGIRVNAILPGPVWTPNIPATMPPEEVEHFGHEVALGRPGQPEELAPPYVLLASDDGSFMTGALVQVTGGKTSGSG